MGYVSSHEVFSSCNGLIGVCVRVRYRRANLVYSRLFGFFVSSWQLHLFLEEICGFLLTFATSVYDIPIVVSSVFHKRTIWRMGHGNGYTCLNWDIMTELQKCSSCFRDSKGFDMIRANGLTILIILAFFLELHEMVSKFVNTTIFWGFLTRWFVWMFSLSGCFHRWYSRYHDYS